MAKKTGKKVVQDVVFEIDYTEGENERYQVTFVRVARYTGTDRIQRSSRKYYVSIYDYNLIMEWVRETIPTPFVQKVAFGRHIGWNDLVD